MKLLAFFTLFILGASASLDPNLVAQDLARRHVQSMMEALKVNDKEGFFKLVTTTKEDEKNYDEVAQLLLGLNIDVTTCSFKNPNEIEAYVTVNGKMPAVLMMEKSPESPTGWSIKAIGGPDLNKEGSRKSFGDWFNICYISLFMCAIKYINEFSIWLGNSP